MSLAAVGLLAAATLAGCQGSGTDDAAAGGQTAASGTSTGTSTGTPSEASYSQCMRDNGVSGFPDPQPNGEIAVSGNDLGVPIDSEQYKQADQACSSLLPQRTAEQEQQDYQARLEYAACIREQGVTGFPDPQVPTGGMETQQNSAGDPTDGLGFDPGSQQFEAANEACKHLLPEGDAGPSLSSQP